MFLRTIFSGNQRAYDSTCQERTKEILKNNLDILNPNHKKFDDAVLSQLFSLEMKEASNPLEAFVFFDNIMKAIQPTLNNVGQDDLMSIKDSLIKASVCNLPIGDRDKLQALLPPCTLKELASKVLFLYDHHGGSSEKAYRAVECLSLISLFSSYLYRDQDLTDSINRGDYTIKPNLRDMDFFAVLI